MPGKLSDRVRETRAEGGGEGLPDEGGIKLVEGGDWEEPSYRGRLSAGQEGPWETQSRNAVRTT